MSSSELTDHKNPFSDETAMRLLSINGVTKQLGINYQTAKKLIICGEIKSITIEGKVKVPLFRLFEYLRDESERQSKFRKSKTEDKEKEIKSNINEHISSIISKHRR